MDALYLLTWTFLDIGNSFVFIRYCIVVIVVVLLLLLFMLMCSMFRRRANDSAILGLYLRLAVIAVPSDLASIGLPQARVMSMARVMTVGERAACVRIMRVGPVSSHYHSSIVTSISITTSSSSHRRRCDRRSSLPATTWTPSVSGRTWWCCWRG